MYFTVVTLNQFQPVSLTLERLLFSSHSLQESRGQVRPGVHPIPGLRAPRCFLQPRSLTQHPPTTQSFPGTSLGEENSFLFHLVGKTGKRKKMSPGGKDLTDSAASLLHTPPPSPRSSLGHRQFLKPFTMLGSQAFHTQILLCVILGVKCLTTLTTSLSLLIPESQLRKSTGHPGP